MTDPDGGWRPVDELRRMFNALRFAERVRTGELQAIVTQHKLKHPDWSPVPLYRQIVRYYDADEEVAIVSQWLHMDGTLAASGLPDPKRLIIEGKVYWTGERKGHL